MSEADPSEVSVVVEQDGLSVEKSYEPDDFPVPAIAFVIQSDREERVHVRLSDAVPDDVDPSDIGFHPNYGAEFWDVDDGRIVFERDFEPGEEYTTVYGLRSETEDVEQYLSEPEFDEVDPPIEDVAQAVNQVINEGDGGDAEADDDEGGDITLDLDDPLGGGADTSTTTSGEGASPSDIEGAIAEADRDAAATQMDETVPEAESEPPSDETTAGSSGDISPANVAEALAAELQEGSVSETAIETLRTQLEPERGSVDARIADLQSEVSDLRAYTGALEEFLDEEGDAQQILDDLDARLADVEESLADIDETTDRNADRIGEVDADLAALDEEVDDVSETLEDLETEVTEVGERVDDVATDVETVREEVGEDIDDRVGDLEDRLDDIQDDLDQLDQMRQQLSSVFGAQPSGGNGGDEDDDE